MHVHSRWDNDKNLKTTCMYNIAKWYGSKKLRSKDHKGCNKGIRHGVAIQDMRKTKASTCMYSTPGHLHVYTVSNIALYYGRCVVPTCKKLNLIKKLDSRLLYNAMGHPSWAKVPTLRNGFLSYFYTKTDKYQFGKQLHLFWRLPERSFPKQKVSGQCKVFCIMFGLWEWICEPFLLKKGIIQ